MKTKDLFYEQLRLDVGYKKSKYALNDGSKAYYNEKYKNALIRFQEKDGVYENFKGLEYKNFGKSRTKICSIASSSRLCYWYFRNKGVQFEYTDYHFKGDDKKEDNCAHFDAKKGNILYECKCQEIITTSHRGLKAYFYKNLVKEKFGISGKFKIEDIENEDGEVIEQIVPTQKQFDIGEKNDKSIYKMHIDLKQLITHLLALGNRKNKDQKIILQYVIFRPTLDKDNQLKKRLYNKCDEEFSSIKESKIIKTYLNSNNIDLPCIKYVDIKDVKDEII